MMYLQYLLVVIKTWTRLAFAIKSGLRLKGLRLVQDSPSLVPHLRIYSKMTVQSKDDFTEYSQHLKPLRMHHYFQSKKTRLLSRHLSRNIPPLFRKSLSYRYNQSLPKRSSVELVASRF